MSESDGSVRMNESGLHENIEALIPHNAAVVIQVLTFVISLEIL
jgi:hypothetical protein